VNNRRKNVQTGQWEDEPVFVDIDVFNRGEAGGGRLTWWSNLSAKGTKSLSKAT